MNKRLVAVDRETPLLMPPTIQEWVAKDDMARFVLEAVELVEDHECRTNWRSSGSAQYPPRMMLGLLIYCYASGVFSSRRIERATYRDIAVRYLCADTHPDHDTIASFRRDNGPLLAACFTRVLGLAKEMKLAKLGEVALDGSKIRASAAKRSTLRWEQAQQQVLELETQVEALLTQAAQTDAHEKNAADGQRLPKELRDKQKRLEAMRRAMASVEQRTAQRAKQREQERNEFDDQGPGSPPARICKEPKAKSPVNTTDPEARLLPQKKGGIEPSYNVQLVVAADSGAPLILTHEVTDTPNDRRQLQPMVGKVIEQIDSVPQKVHADTGYDNAAQIHQVEQSCGVEIYCPPEEGGGRAPSEVKHRQTRRRQRTQEQRQRMRERMDSEEGRESQKVRATSVEPVFG